MTNAAPERKVTSFVPNSFSTPNFFVDHLLHLLEPKEWVVLSFVTRHILGWQDKVAARTAAVSVSMLEHGFTSAEKQERYYGCGLARPTIIAALDKLVEFKILERLGEAGPDGQRWHIPDDDSQIDYAGLQKRIDDKFERNQKRTAKGSKKSAEKRLAGKSDLPGGVVNGTYQDWYVGFTSAGKSDLLNQIQDQNQVKTKTWPDRDKSLPAGGDPFGSNLDDLSDNKHWQEKQKIKAAAERLGEPIAHDRLLSSKPDEQNVPAALTPVPEKPLLVQEDQAKGNSVTLVPPSGEPLSPVSEVVPTMPTALQEKPSTMPLMVSIGPSLPAGAKEALPGPNSPSAAKSKRSPRKVSPLPPLARAIGQCLLRQSSEAGLDANRPYINKLQRLLLTCEGYAPGSLPTLEQSQVLAGDLCLKFIPWYEAETLARYGHKNDLPAGEHTLPKWYGEWLGLSKPGPAAPPPADHWMPELV